MGLDSEFGSILRNILFVSGVFFVIWFSFLLVLLGFLRCCSTYSTHIYIYVCVYIHMEPCSTAISLARPREVHGSVGNGIIFAVSSLSGRGHGDGVQHGEPGILDQLLIRLVCESIGLPKYI